MIASSHEACREALEFYYLLQLQRLPRRVRPSLDNHDRGGCLLPLFNSLWQQSWFRSAMRRNNQSDARFREIKRHHRSYLAPIFVDFGWREKAPRNARPEIGVRVFPLLSAEDLLCVDAPLHRSRSPVSRHPGACMARVHGLPVFSRSAALPAYQCPGLPRGRPGCGKFET